MTAAPPSVGRSALLAALAHFLGAWPLELGRSTLRALEAVAFGRLPPIAGRVLDLGCGDGTFGRWVTTTDDLYGVDSDVDRIRAAASCGVRGVTADAAYLPFRSGSFDTVIANSTLEHLADPAGTMRAVARVLRPGGRFIFTVPLAAVLDNLFFAAGVAGADYRQHFTAYWQHRTMESADGWAELIATYAPALSLVRRWPLESPRQTAIIDLLWSVKAAAAPLIDGSPALRDAQRLGLADLLGDLMTTAEDRPDDMADSAVIIECVKWRDGDGEG